MEIPGTLLSHNESLPYAQRISNLLNHPKAISSFPGAQPISFEEKHSQVLLEKNYFVSEKADGIRLLMFSTVINAGLPQQPKWKPITIFIDRKNDYYKINDFGLPRNNAQFLVDSLVDGELIYDKTPDGKQILYFLIFDALMVDGKSLVERPYTSRLGYLRELVLKPYLEKIKKDPLYKKTHRFEIRQKKVEPSYHMDKVFQQVKLYRHESDGLIFTSADAAYHFGTCDTMIKWKPPSENTVDFMLQVNKTPEGDKYYISIFHGAKGYQFESDFVFGSDFEKVKGEKLHGRIIECKYDRDWPHFWRFSRFRDDKPDANHVSTFIKVQKSIQDNVTKEKLLEMREKIEVSWKERESSKKGVKRGADSSSSSMITKAKTEATEKEASKEHTDPKGSPKVNIGKDNSAQNHSSSNSETMNEKQLLSVDFD